MSRLGSGSGLRFRATRSTARKTRFARTNVRNVTASTSACARRRAAMTSLSASTALARRRRAMPLIACSFGGQERRDLGGAELDELLHLFELRFEARLVGADQRCLGSAERGEDLLHEALRL